MNRCYFTIEGKVIGLAPNINRDKACNKKLIPIAVINTARDGAFLSGL